MATYDYEIVNLALVRLGSKRISSLSDTTRNALEANAIWTTVRDNLLKIHPWKFATRRAQLAAYVENVLTISGITQADPGVLTYSAGTDPENGDVFLLEDIVGMTDLNDEYCMVHGVTAAANTFNLYDEDGEPIDTSGYDAYVSGGTATESIPLTEDFEYLFSLPTDFLAVVHLNDDFDEEYEVDEHGLMCNSDSVMLTYVRQVTDVTVYTPEFIDALAWQLASDLAIAITGDMMKLKAAATMAAIALETAKRRDAASKKPVYPEFTRYRDSRR